MNRVRLKPILFGLLLNSVLPLSAFADNGSVAVVSIVQDITLDGKFDDWGDDIPWQPIALNLYGDPDSAENDCVGKFRVGVDPEKMRLYFAVEAIDESVVDPPSQNANWTTHDAVSLALGPTPDFVFTKKDTPYQRTFEMSTPPLIENGKFCSEYSVLLSTTGVTSLDTPYVVSLVMGYLDKDDDGSFTAKYWSPEAFKFVANGRQGDLIVCAANKGRVVGELQDANLESQVGAVLLDFEAVDNPALRFRLRTDARCKYELDLPEGTYRRSGTNIVTSTIEVRSGETTVDSINYRIEASERFPLADHELGANATLGYEPRPAKAAADDYFEMSKLNGLSGQRVLSLAQDPNGVLWIGTQANLARFDGTTLRVFDDSIGRETRCMWTDQERGRVWIGGRHQVGYLSEDELTTFPLLQDRRANCIGPTHDGRVLIGTICGLFLWDGDRFKYHAKESGMPENWINATALDKKNGLTWVGTNEGLAAFDGQRYQIFDQRHGLADPRVVSLYVDSRGTLWIGTASSLFRYDHNQFHLVRRHKTERVSYVRSFAELPNGTVVVGALDGLIRIPPDFPANDYSFTAHGRPTDSLLFDRDNQLWQGFEDGRLRRYDMGLQKVYSNREVLVSSIFSVSDHLWMLQKVTKDEPSKPDPSRYRVVKLDKQTFKETTVEMPEGIEDVDATAFLATANGVWIGTRSKGAFSLVDGNWQQLKTPGSVQSICEDPQGRCWIATEQNVYRVENQDLVPMDRPAKGSAHTIHRVIASPDGQLAVSMSAGIQVFRDGKKLTYHNRSNGLISDVCYSMTYDRNGFLWVCTPSGLQAIGESESRVFSESNALLDNNLSFVTSWDGEIWCGSRIGINRISNQTGLVQHLLGKNGFGQSQICSAAPDGDVMWLGGETGVWRYQRASRRPQVFFDDIITDETIGVAEELSVTTDLKKIGIHFHANSLKDRRNGVIFQYRLLGSDEKWQATRETQLELVVPTAGDYQFELKATDRDLLTSEISRIKVHVGPPYARLAKELALVIAGLACVVLGVLYFRSVREKSAELEKRVEERTAELSETQQQLKQSQKMEALGTLSSGVAHDFNNSLQAIVANAELALMSVTDPEPRELLSEVRAVGKQASELTTSMLMFGGPTDSQKSVIDLRQALWDAEKILRRTLSASVEFECLVPTTPVACMADSSQIQQVILNLALNARDAMPEGGLLSIKLAEHEHVAKITVRDNGQGMSAETQARVFEPFYTEKPRGKGTGLGLSVVHAIVKDHLGEIQVESSLGHGTEFVLKFPTATNYTHQDKSTALHLEEASGRVLIADDDPTVLKVVSTAMHKAGYDIEASHDGLVKEQDGDGGNYDLLILDVDMPGKSGWQLLEEIRETQNDVPAIIMSGYPQEIRRSDERTVCIRKPFSIRDLTNEAARLVKSEAD